MIIGIDGNEANAKDGVGVNTYGFNLLWGLYNIREKWQDDTKVIVYLKDKPREDLPKESFCFKYKVIPGKGLWILKKLTPALFKDRRKIDVFLSPSHYIPFLAPVPKVCSIMDLGYLKRS